MDTQSTPRLITKVALYVTLFTPFIVASSLFFPYITGKNIFFRIVISIAALAWGYLMWKERQQILASPIILAFGAFVIGLLLSALFGIDIEKSLWSNFERMEGWVTIALLFGFLILLLTVFREKEEWKSFLTTSLVVSILICFLGIFEIGKVARVDATLGNSTYLGVYTLFHLWIAVYLLWHRLKEMGSNYTGVFRDGRAFFFASVALLNLIVMYFTGTRSVFVGLFIGLIVASGILALRLPKGDSLKKASIGVCAVLILIIPLFLSIRSTDFVQDSNLLSRFANISLEDDTTRSRTLLWGMGLEIFKERPLLGWGQDNFIYGFAEHYDSRMYDQEEWFDRAHNVFFDWLTQGGLLGLLFYLSLFLSAFYVLWRSQKIPLEVKALFAGLLVAHFTNNFFVFDNITSYVMFIIVLAYIAFLSRDDQKMMSLNVSRGVVVSLVVISLFGLYTAGMSYMNARGIIKGLMAIRSENLPRAQEEFVRVIERGGPGQQEAVEQFGLSISPDTLRDLPPEDVEAYVVKATSVADEYVANHPLNPRTALFRGVLYARTGQREKAKTAFEEAITLMPEKQSALIGYAEVLLALGETEEALVITERLYTENPHFEKLKIAYIVTLFQVDEDEKALALLDEERIIEPNLARILYDRGHYAYVADILSELSKREPDNPQLRVSLAAAYYHAGNKGRALQVMQQVIKDFPGLRTQAEQIINQIVTDTLPREVNE